MFDDARNYVLELIEQKLEQQIERLPTDRQITEKVTASYATVRLVMGNLERDGFIRRIRGAGTYITTSAKELLEQLRKKHLVFFRPPNFGNSANCYNEWVASQLRNQAELKGWKITIMWVSSHDDFLKNVHSVYHSVDAIVYLPVSESFTLEQLSELRKLDSKSFVILDFELPNLSIYNIATDNRRGGGLAAKYLLSMNHKKIGVLVCEPKLNQCSARVQGISEMLDLVEIKPAIIDCHVKKDDDRYALAYNTVKQQLKTGLDITALFAVSDSGALGAIQAIEDAGFKVPEDISVIGFDGLEIGKTIKPALTTIKQPVMSMMEKIFKILDNKADGEKFQTLLAPDLLIRNSVKKLNTSRNSYKIEQTLETIAVAGN